MATRQFETAIETCETLFRATTMSAAAIDLLGVFEDYLKIVLRVREDFARAIATCEQFLGRADVTPDLRERLLSWVEALGNSSPRGSLGRRWGRARTLIEAGQRRNRFPADQLGLVHFVVASPLASLRRCPGCHHAGSLWKPTTSLASPNHLSRGPRGVAETPFFLKMAIRLDPQSPMAAKAYDLLNAYILAAYTGSSGVHLPQDVQEYLGVPASLAAGVLRLGRGSMFLNIVKIALRAL